MKLFKSGEDILKKAEDLMKGGHFSEARDTYEKANKKFFKQGNKELMDLTNAYVALLELKNKKDDPEAYRYAAECLKELDNKNIKLGIREIPSSDLAKECIAKAEYIISDSLPDETQEDQTVKAQELEKTAQQYNELDDYLVLEEVLFNNKLKGTDKFPFIAAESLKWKAEASVWSNPIEAAKYYQNAANFLKSDPQLEQSFIHKTNQFGKVAKCWFCGREVYAENIHFIPMKSLITQYQINKLEKGKGKIPVFDNEHYIYVCRACHDAIYLKADEIALDYHEKAIDELNKVKDQLITKINELDRKIKMAMR